MTGMVFILPARLARLAPLAVVATAILLLGARPAPSRPAHPATRIRCDRVATTSISFGQTGGTLKPNGVRIEANGVVRVLGASSAGSHTAAAVPTRELRRLARRAWTGPFASLPTAPTRPTPNPDAARDFIELRSACGVKHVEYQSGSGAPEFRHLLAALEALTTVR
jgi:hypothetical protein